MNRPPIHILLATCNGARFLPCLLDSLLRQTDPDWIVFARDDGSDDDTPVILARYAQADARIRLIRDGAGRLGVRGNFERLLAHALAADAESFALCDQDDVWLPDKLCVMRAALEAGMLRNGPTAPLMAYADLAHIDAGGTVIADSHFERAGAAAVRSGVGRWLLAHNVIPGCAMFGNRALLERALPFPAQVYHHDWWLAALAATCGDVLPVDRTLTHYRQHPGNAVGAASPARRAFAFVRRFGPSMAAARAQYRRAVEQAAALLERAGDAGHAEWLDAARWVRDRLGAARRSARLLAVAVGPVRRIGCARNALMFAAALYDPAARGERGQPQARQRARIG